MTLFLAALEHQARRIFAAFTESAAYKFGWCYEQADDLAEFAREGLCDKEEQEEVAEPPLSPCLDSDKCQYCPTNDGIDCTVSCAKAKQDWLDAGPTAWVDHDYTPMPRKYEDVSVKITPVEGSGIPPTAPSTGGCECWPIENPSNVLRNINPDCPTHGTPTDPSPTTRQAATTVGDEGSPADRDIPSSPAGEHPNDGLREACEFFGIPQRLMADVLRDIADDLDPRTTK